MKQAHALSEAASNRVILKANGPRPSVTCILHGDGKEMMLPPQTRELAQRLLAYENGAGKTSESTEFAAIRICDRLRQPIIVLTGVAGFRSLLSRALTLGRGAAGGVTAAPRLNVMNLKVPHRAAILAAPSVSH